MTIKSFQKYQYYNYTALAEARVNIKMIDQGSSELNIIIGVADEDFEVAMRAIYDAFIEVKK